MERQDSGEALIDNVFNPNRKALRRASQQVSHKQ